MRSPRAASQRGIALDGRLLAARHDDLQLAGRIIQRAAGGDGLDLRLVGAGRDQHRNARHVLVHAAQAKVGGRQTSKRKMWF